MRNDDITSLGITNTFLVPTLNRYMEFNLLLYEGIFGHLVLRHVDFSLFVQPPPPGEDSHIKRAGMLVRIFQMNP